jgi:acyl-CoA synthetase (NDP forming)
VLPDFLPPRNPLDLGTLIAWKPELVGQGVKAMLDDDGIGAVLISLPMVDPEMAIGWMKSYLEAYRASDKPAIYVVLSEDKPLAPGLLKLIDENQVIVMRSTERALRALAKYTLFGSQRRLVGDGIELKAFSELPALEHGTQVEWLGKKVLSASGVAVPVGALATTSEEAVAIAAKVGFPVVMKAQATSLAHKSEVGGVLLNLKDPKEVRSAWGKLHDNVKKARPDLILDGALVEAMGPPGLELVVGATRDPQWGPIIMIGLGGVWVEALGDVRLIPPDLSRDGIIAEIWKLKAAKLLNGFRGAPPVDVEAVADVVQAVGRLMLTEPTISEVDVNPLIAYPRGEGVMALDALIVTREEGVS